MYAVEFDRFSWKYAGEEGWALNQIDLKINAGEFVGIMGPSGAGKTTLALSMNGLIPLRLPGTLKGDVRVAGKSSFESEIHDLTKDVGLVFQDPETQFVSMKVRNEIAFGMENLGLPRDEMENRLEWAIEKLRLHGMLEKPPTELSGGQKQRVAIASILVTNPKVFVFDEPVSDLDPVGRREVYESIAKVRAETKAAIVAIDHELEELAKHADRLILMNRGRIELDLPKAEFLEHVEDIEKTGETLPQITKLFWNLKKEGIWDGAFPFTLEQAMDSLPSDVGSRIKRALSEKRFSIDDRYQLGQEDQVSVDNLTYIYPDGTMALNDVSLQIKKGEYVAIVGQNGSGKTTLVKHFNGLLMPTRGRLEVNGISIPGDRIRELPKHVGNVFQNPDHQLFSNTVLQELMFGPLQLGLDKDKAEQEARKVMDILNLTEWANEHPFFLGKGQRRRLAVGSVLTTNPETFIVDEPTTGQDWRGSKEMMMLFDQLNKERGITLVVITHNMRLVAEHCPRVIVMSKGRILYDGLSRQLFARRDILKEAFLSAPQITEFVREFSNGTQELPLTVEETMPLLESLDHGN